MTLKDIENGHRVTRIIIGIWFIMVLIISCVIEIISVIRFYG